MYLPRNTGNHFGTTILLLQSDINNSEAVTNLSYLKTVLDPTSYCLVNAKFFQLYKHIFTNFFNSSLCHILQLYLLNTPNAKPKYIFDIFGARLQYNNIINLTLRTSKGFILFNIYEIIQLITNFNTHDIKCIIRRSMRAFG
jgi:hypothetical protein